MTLKSFTCPFPVDENLFLSLCKEHSEIDGMTLLHSGKGYDKHAKSYLALFPVQSIIIDNEEDPWQELQNSLKLSGLKNNIPEYLGYISYEMGAFSTPHKRLPYTRKGHPLAVFIKPLILFVWNREKKCLEAFLNGENATCISEERMKQITMLKNRDWNRYFDSFSLKKEEAFSLTPISKEEKLDYSQKYHKIKEHLSIGDIYQVCLTRQEEYACHGNDFDWFWALSRSTPMPYAAFMRIKEGAILSLSPERFLKKDGDVLITQPIKGTAKREEDPYADERVRNKLLLCKKNDAELVMITDLMRNDLSRVCIPGSVKVHKLKYSEKYPYVWHLVSDIRGQIRKGINPIKCLQVCFPPGSISGCPKISAQEIISKQEGRSRGVYTGAMGYINSEGDFDFNVAIRTIWISDAKAYIQAGGAILDQSYLESEWEEALIKLKGMTEFSPRKANACLL